jgi:hypothetical protein
MLAMVVNDNAGIQTARVIVEIHREHARSYRCKSGSMELM